MSRETSAEAKAASRDEAASRAFATWAAATEGADAASCIAFFLMHRYGPLLSRDQLVAVLGFPTSEALERAVQRGSLPLKVSRIPKRRGLFALAPDVARYLVEVSRVDVDPKNREEREIGT